MAYRVSVDAGGRRSLPCMGPTTPAEVAFAEYLDERGYDFEFEPPLGRHRPDFLVHPKLGPDALIEVEEFSGETTIFTSPTFDDAHALKPIRNKIRDAARQLKEFEETGRPLVVALANPHGAQIILNPWSILAAMKGDLAYTFPVSRTTGGQAGPGSYVLSRNGKLTNDHAYISAVLLIHRYDHAVEWDAAWSAGNRHRWEDIDDKRERIRAALEARAARDESERPDGYTIAVDAFYWPGATAVPIDTAVFSGDRDRIWTVDPDGRVIEPAEYLDVSHEAA